jgi:UDP-GlcNAc:undecaprenyl-phosphate/decaprenyl-phosphate GlcNAc-1-phosphate transferase
MAYLAAFLLCLILSIVGTWCVRNAANARGWIHEPKLDRHMHTIPVPRLGGVAIYFSFMTVVILAMVIPELLGRGTPLHVKAIAGLLGPALIVFLLGLYDDVYSLNAYWKFGIETIAAIGLYAGGYGIHNLGLIHGGEELNWIYGLPLTVLWVLLITNAFNLIDGLDGLAAGSAVFSTIVVFVMSLIAPKPLVAFLAIALAGATLGFLRFNFHPASIFLGDSGSLFIGFMLAALALAGSEKAPTIVAVAIPIVSLGLPILDVVLAVLRRFLAGKPLFDGDKHHIHHKLLKRGLSQRNAVLTLYAVTAGFGFLSLVLLQQRRAIALVLGVVGIGIFLGVQQLRYQEFAELLSVLQRVTRRRQILANHVAIRLAAERLKECNDLGSICQILRDTLEPIGFDAVRFLKQGKNGFSSSMIQPICYLPDGTWLFSWFAHEIAEPPWELKLELMNGSMTRWGYLSLIRMSNENPLPLDLNMLTAEFRCALSGAIERATSRLEELEKSDGDEGNGRTRATAAGTMAD